MRYASDDMMREATVRFITAISMAGWVAACSSASAPTDAEADRQVEPPTAEELGFCGGVAGVACPDGMFCEYPVGNCGANDETGTCRTMPDACTMDFDPVCGCDGQTYPNACAASAEGVSLGSTEPCPGDP